jgi:hypothetical protein
LLDGHSKLLKVLLLGFGQQIHIGLFAVLQEACSFEPTLGEEVLEEGCQSGRVGFNFGYLISSLGWNWSRVSDVVLGMLVGTLVILVVGVGKVIISGISGRGVAIDGGLEVRVLVGTHGRMEKPVPCLD